MNVTKALKLRSYSTASEEWQHNTRRCRIDSYSRFSSLKGRLVCLLLIPLHISGIVTKPIYYTLKSANHIFESFACMAWKAKYFREQAKAQARTELKDGLKGLINVIVSPAGQILQVTKAAVGVFHPKAYFQGQPKEISGNQKVIIVGAGPVGLLTAIQTKILKPELEVTLIERNQEYQRNNRLNLKKRSFSKITQKDPQLNAIIKDFLKKRNQLSFKQV